MRNSRSTKKRSEIEIKEEAQSLPSGKRSKPTASTTSTTTKKEKNVDNESNVVVAVVAETKKQQQVVSVAFEAKTKNQKPEQDSDNGVGPFPRWRRPSEAECFAARDALARLHGEPSSLSSSAVSPSRSSSSSPSKQFSDPDGCHNDDLSVLDSLVRTILSQNTTDATSIRAFRSLKEALPSWERVRTARKGVVEEAIRVGGLADIKAARIKKILETIRSEAIEKKRRGEGTKSEGRDDAESLLSLEYLRGWSDEEAIKQHLVRFDGVGPKTAACVVLFALKRADFPVDTHINRIAAALGWVPKNSSREQSYEHLRRKVPQSCVFDLHVLLVAHGKVCPVCKSVGRGGGSSGGKCELRAAVAAVAAAEKSGEKK